MMSGVRFAYLYVRAQQRTDVRGTATRLEVARKGASGAGRFGKMRVYPQVA